MKYLPIPNFKSKLVNFLIDQIGMKFKAENKAEGKGVMRSRARIIEHRKIWAKTPKSDRPPSRQVRRAMVRRQAKRTRAA